MREGVTGYGRRCCSTGLLLIVYNEVFALNRMENDTRLCTMCIACQIFIQLFNYVLQFYGSKCVLLYW